MNSTLQLPAGIILPTVLEQRLKTKSHVYIQPSEQLPAGNTPPDGALASRTYRSHAYKYINFPRTMVLPKRNVDGSSRDTLLQELRAIEAHEASVQLELFKKAGVYSVLKRIEVWQKRTGKRLSEGFHGGTGEPRSTTRTENCLV